MVTVEVVVSSVDEALRAVLAGAGRLEVVSAPEQGGLTPSFGLVKLIRRLVQVPIFCMLRTRPGGFSVSSLEYDQMLADARALQPLCDGLVFGILGEDRSLDLPKCRQLIQEADGKDCVLHRAFDCTVSLERTLEQSIECGFRRILSGGGHANAMDGHETIKTLIAKAAGRIEICPAGSIRTENAKNLIAATGANSLHLGPRKPSEDRATNPNLYRPEYTTLDDEAVKQVIRSLAG